MYRFEDPWALVLLTVLPILAVWYWRRASMGGTISYPRVPALREAAGGKSSRVRSFLFVLRLAGLAGLIVAFARPQSGITDERITTEGIDIVLVMEQQHKQRLMAEYPGEMRFKELHVLDIPDNYKFMDAELITEITAAVEPSLTNYAG